MQNNSNTFGQDGGNCHSSECGLLQDAGYCVGMGNEEQEVEKTAGK
jgi:hypothetical protein